MKRTITDDFPPSFPSEPTSTVESGTPRTDALILDLAIDARPVEAGRAIYEDIADFARQLERELSSTNAVYSAVCHELDEMRDKVVSLQAALAARPEEGKP